MEPDKRPVVIHVIYDLGRGGAETLLVNTVRELNNYCNILVTLRHHSEFGENLPFFKIINLNCPSTFNLPVAILRLKAIIKKYEPQLIHAHLPLPNIIARLTTPRSIPLISTIHTTVSMAAAYKKFHFRVLDRFSNIFRKDLVIGVSQNVIDDYKTFLQLPDIRSKVLYNFAHETKHLKTDKLNNDGNLLRMVAVGTIKPNKNYECILESLNNLNDQRFSLDIFGKGKPPSVFDQTQKISLPVQFKGTVENIEEQLCNYDVFISASRFEGFSVSVLEAMAAKLILLVSDIPSHREQCGDTAIYFSLDDPEDLRNKLNYCIANKEHLQEMAEQALDRFQKFFTLEKYVTNLQKIYVGEMANLKKHSKHSNQNILQ